MPQKQPKHRHGDCNEGHTHQGRDNAYGIVVRISHSSQSVIQGWEIWEGWCEGGNLKEQGRVGLRDREGGRDKLAYVMRYSAVLFVVVCKFIFLCTCSNEGRV